MKLTATTVRTLALPAGKREYTFFDNDLKGFGVRVREAGSRKFVFQYKIGAKHRRMVLGTASPATLADARKTAERLQARVRLGEDPFSDKAEAQADAAKTFKSVVVEYLDYQRPPRLRPRSFPDLERHLTKHARTLHQLQLGKITKRDVASVLTTVKNNSGAVTANRVRTSLSGFFSWAMEQGYVDENPVVGTPRNKEQSRERVLAPAELRAIWNALGEDHFGDIVKLLALTAQREAEIAALLRSEIHGAQIILPAERTKNKRAHVVPLSRLALAIIERQPLRTTSAGQPRDLFFGLRDGSPFSGWSRSKEELDKRIAAALGKPLPHWTLHDLRRTFATYVGGGMPAHELEKLTGSDKEMACGLGVQPHVIEAVLNHVSGHKAGVAGTYNRSTYEPEKRMALDLWADHLLAIAQNRASNVTSLRRA